MAHEIVESVINSAPWYIALGAVIFGWARQLYRGATKTELRETEDKLVNRIELGERELDEKIEKARAEADKRIETCHQGIRSDIEQINKNISILTKFLLGRVRHDANED